ncbi:hypothetical protein M3Y99_01213200 [Aphelenchoides fujianensis]|nr:hypothetical protein M3Y99_01213200 [Aphelenchoides fujianensis]
MKLIIVLLVVQCVLFVECAVRSSRFPRPHHRLGRRHHEREVSERHDGWRRGARHNSTREGEEETSKWGLDGRREGKTNHKHWNHSAANENESEEQFHRDQKTAEWGSEGAHSAEGHEQGAHRRGGQVGWTHGGHRWGHRGHEDGDRPGRGGHTRPDHRAGHEHRHHDDEERIPGGQGRTTPDKHAGDEDRVKTHKDGHQRPHGHRHTHDEDRPGKHHSHGDEQGRGTFTGPQGAKGHEQEPKEQEATSPAPLGQGAEVKKPTDCGEKDEKPADLGQEVGQSKDGESEPKGEQPLGQGVDEKNAGRTEEAGGVSGGFEFGWTSGQAGNGGKFNPGLYCEMSRSAKCLAIQRELCAGGEHNAALHLDCTRNYCSGQTIRCKVLQNMSGVCHAHGEKKEKVFAQELCS